MKLDLFAIYSIWLREMLRFFRLKSRLIGSVGAPFFFLAFLGMGFGSSTTITGIPQGIGYVSFLTPGIIGMTLLFSATFAGISVLWDRQFGFLKEIMVAPVSRIAIVLGRTAGGVTTGILQAMIILISGMALGMIVPSLQGFVMSLVFMILIAATFIGMGLAFASQMEDMSGFSLIMNFLIFPLFFFLPGARIRTRDLVLPWLMAAAFLSPILVAPFTASANPATHAGIERPDRKKSVLVFM